MKLELNLPALERLIGGDTEIELQLRRQIVEEFSKRYLKEIANTVSHTEAKKAAEAYVNAAAKEVFDIENLTTDHLWPTVGYRFKSLIQKLVEEQAQNIVDETLRSVIEYQQHYWGKEVTDAIKKAMDRQIEKEIQEGIQKRLEAAKHIGTTKTGVEP